MGLSYDKILPNGDFGWGLVDTTSTPQQPVVVNYRPLPSPTPGARLVSMYVDAHQPRFWFPEWMIDEHGVSLMKSQCIDRVSAVTPPLRMTFNPAEPNTTARLYDGQIDGFDAYYSGVVAHKEVLDLPNRPSEWVVRIQAKGNSTQRVGADVTLRLGQGVILQYYGICGGVAFSLKDLRLFEHPELLIPAPPEPAADGGPAPDAHKPAPKPPKPGHPAPAPPPYDPLKADYYYRRWNAQCYLDQCKREDEIRAANQWPARQPDPLEKKMKKEVDFCNAQIKADSDRMGPRPGVGPNTDGAEIDHKTVADEKKLRGG